MDIATKQKAASAAPVRLAASPRPSAPMVVTTALGTEIGHITGLLAGVEDLTTPLLRQMNQFARWLAAVVVTVAAAIFAFGVAYRGYIVDEMFKTVVGLAVAGIPEGLPAILTVTLTIGVQRMAARRAIIRRLPAVETLGSISLICSDKTGTLTRNEMTLRRIVTAGGDFDLTGTGYAPEGAVTARKGAAPPPLALLRAALLCGDAALVRGAQGWTVSGDPMEGALVAGAMKAGLDPAAEAAAWPRLGFLIVQDIVVVIAMVVLSAIDAGQAAGADTSGAGGAAGEIAMVFVWGAVMVAASLAIIRWVAKPLTRMLAGSPELLIAFAVAWATLFAAVGDYLGFSKELGGLLAGVTLASTPLRETLASRLLPLRDFLLLFFFVGPGAQRDLGLVMAQVPKAQLLSAFVLVATP